MYFGMLFGISFFSFGFGLYFIFGEVISSIQDFGLKKEIKKLKEVQEAFKKVEEILESGLYPGNEMWDGLKKLPSPWGNLSFRCLRELRLSGAPLLPTLKRLRSLAKHQNESLLSARAKASQALFQATFCLLLVPLLGLICYALHPSLTVHFRGWMMVCSVAFLLCGLGAIWIVHLSETARWGGIQPKNRNWIFLSQCSCEGFLALVRGGHPPDVAWKMTLNLLTETSQSLSKLWSEDGHRMSGAIENSILCLGIEIKKAIKRSLAEGVSCGEQVENLLSTLKKEMESHTERELSLLGMRALKPLFFCIAPALFGQLLFSLLFVIREAFVDLF